MSHNFFRKCDSFRDISVQLALGPGRSRPGRFKPEMGLGGENTHFLFYTPYVKNASISKYTLVFPLSLHLPCELSLRSASSPHFARNCYHSLKPTLIEGLQAVVVQSTIRSSSSGALQVIHVFAKLMSPKSELWSVPLQLRSLQ